MSPYICIHKTELITVNNQWSRKGKNDIFP